MKAARPLAGLRVGISVSNSADLEDRGFTPAGMNRLTVSLAGALLDAGATLAFGHDWRREGIMEAVCHAALDSFGCPEGDAPPLILNLIPWPEKTVVPAGVLSRLPGLMAIEEAGLPPELREAGERVPTRDSEAWRDLRARGLTYLRQRLTEVCEARVCLGGKESGYEGRYPGILEEALFALEAGQPLYLVGLLGGAALHLGQTILDDAPPPAEFGAEVRDAWSRARGLGVERLAANGLSLEENRRLLETSVEGEVFHLILAGLLRQQREALPPV
ncbi:MAG TPA: hypothetical protein VF173_38350 [Thermoanaerobaculia bacterium]|nr:hypothetical protein [Thermoanaerobaculia bacterium]